MVEDDRFDVTFDPGRTSVEDMLRAIRAIDFEPTVVARPGAGADAGTGLTRVDVAKLPADLSAMFARAADAERRVLLHFSGPG